MKSLRELLHDADPLRDEPTRHLAQHEILRRAFLAAASSGRPSAGARSRSRMAVLSTVAFMLLAVLFRGSRMRSVLVSDLQAAVRFEVRLAEDKPAAGLREVKLAGSDRSVYIHPEVVVSNSDIAAARAVRVSSTSEYSINIEFRASGAEKMRAATSNHIGKPVAILLDGEVVMAPVLRTAIAASARITSHFTQAQAERIASGIEIQ